MGAWTYFALILPAFAPPQRPSWSLSFLPFPILLVISLYIIYCIAWSYRSACLIPPGLVSTFASNAIIQSRDDLNQMDILWKSYTERAKSASAWIKDSSSDEILANYQKMAEETGATQQEMDDEDLWPRVKMCMKCQPIPLWKALAFLPPELREVERKNREKDQQKQQEDIANTQGTPSLRSRGVSPAPPTIPGAKPNIEPEDALQTLRDSILEWLPESQAYTLVAPPKPERTHHCSICKTCIVKYDHHCPWLNQCVGLYNERYFMMFLFYLSTGCMVVVATGWRPFWKAAHLFDLWSHPLVPRPFMLLTFILALIMGICLIIMGGNHLLLVSVAETSVENSDADHYKHLAKRKGRHFRNVYDLGRRQNLALFWNITSDRGVIRALLPFHYPVYSDGWHWAKRRGLGGFNWGVNPEEEFTDDEDQQGQGQGEIVGRVPKNGAPIETSKKKKKKGGKKGS
ncbi:unnamed protein product [Sympodiomycopsis kandeliae]